MVSKDIMVQISKRADLSLKTNLFPRNFFQISPKKYHMSLAVKNMFFFFFFWLDQYIIFNNMYFLPTYLLY
jgi:hypothetical protein